MYKRFENSRMDYYGYVGKILHVDVGTGEIRKEQLDLGVAKALIGGVGLDHRLAWDLMKPGTDALASENPLIIGAGPLVGTVTPGATRVFGTTKEPLGGVIASGGGGMRLGSNMKWAGYDSLVITGKAESPIYVKIVDDDIEICDASDLWGKKDLFDTTDFLWDRYPGCGVLAIGRGGENLVKFALGIIDKTSTMGRGGLGAVMGSKNLKAIVAKGTGAVRVAEPERLKQAVDSLFERVRKYPRWKTCVDYGITENFDNYIDWLFYRGNWIGQYPPDKAKEIYGPQVYDKVKRGRMGCTPCFIHDKDIFEIKEGKHKGLISYNSSWISTVAVGTTLGIEDAHDAIKLLDQLDRYGVDYMAFRGLVSFLIDLKEKGVITEKDVGGLPLSWDVEDIMTWLDKITLRDGFGDVAANGWLAVFKRLGRSCEKYAYVVKGKECHFDPRTAGLGTMPFDEIVSCRGPNSATGGSATYQQNVPVETFKRQSQRMGMFPEAEERVFGPPWGINIGRLTRYSNDWYMVLSSLGICNRHLVNRFYTVDNCAEIYSAVTGIETTPQELAVRADRGWNMLKVLNVREGFGRKDDTVPEGWFQPLRGGRGEELLLRDYYNTKLLTREDIETFVEDYYDERGWDKQTGIPTREKLIQLGLQDIADELKSLGLL